MADPSSSMSEVERFLLQLGLPRTVVDVFKQEECDDLSAFMYLRPEDLQGLGLDAAAGAEQLDAVQKTVLAGVDEIKVQTDHAWEDAETEDGRLFYFNPVTQETRWDQPPKPWRKPRFDINWQAALPSPSWDYSSNNNELPVDVDASNFPFPEARSSNTTYFDLALNEALDHDEPPPEAWAPLAGVPFEALPTSEQRKMRNQMVIEVSDDKNSSAAGGLHFDLSPKYDVKSGGDDVDDLELADSNEHAHEAYGETNSGRWYVCVDGQTGATEGPFDYDDLKHWLDTGSLEKGTLVTDYTTQDWYTLEEAVNWLNHIDTSKPDHFLMTPEGDVVGPYLVHDISSWIEHGELLPGTCVREGTDGEWMPVMSSNTSAADEVYLPTSFDRESHNEIKEVGEVDGSKAHNAALDSSGSAKSSGEAELDNMVYRFDAISGRENSLPEAVDFTDFSTSRESIKITSPSSGRLFAPFYAGGLSPSAQWKRAANKMSESTSNRLADVVQQASANCLTEENIDVFRIQAEEPENISMEKEDVDEEIISPKGRYYFMNNSEGDVEGPFPSHDLIAWYRSGMVAEDSIVCENGSDEWVALSTLVKEGDSGGDFSREILSNEYADDATDEWYLLSENNNTLGPYSYQDLHAWYSDAQIASDQLVAGPGMEDWVELGRVMEQKVENEDVEHDQNENMLSVDGTQSSSDAEVYVLGAEGNTLGPYAYRDILHWYKAGEIDENAFLSISGQEWEAASNILADEVDIAEENLDEASGGGGFGGQGGDVYVSVEGDIQGPYYREDIQYWLSEGLIDEDCWMSVAGSDWMPIRNSDALAIDYSE